MSEASVRYAPIVYRANWFYLIEKEQDREKGKAGNDCSNQTRELRFL
jgi:hypothetical protein